MKKFLYLLIGVFVLTSTFLIASEPSNKEQVEFTFPADEQGVWKLDQEECIDEENYTFNVWVKENEEEFISLFSRWFDPSDELPTLDMIFNENFGNPEEYANEVAVEFLNETETTMLVKATSLSDTFPEAAYVRFMIGSESVHTLSYLCEGDRCRSLDHGKWIQFLEEAHIVT